MAARSLTPRGGRRPLRRRLPLALLLAAAVSAAPAGAAPAAEERKVWRALAEESRGDAPRPAADPSGARGRGGLPREVALALALAAALLLAGGGLALQRRRRAPEGPVPAPSGPSGDEPLAGIEEDDVEGLWRAHLRARVGRTFSSRRIWRRRGEPRP